MEELFSIGSVVCTPGDVSQMATHLSMPGALNKPARTSGLHDEEKELLQDLTDADAVAAAILGVSREDVDVEL